MKRFVRVLSMLLALVMMVGLLPLSVMAEETHATHMVQFKLNYNGAHKIPSQTVADGEYATEPEDVTREGWIFEYWYVKNGDNGIQKFDLSQPITEDVTLYAHWDEDIEYWGSIWNRGILGAIEDSEDDEENSDSFYTVTFDANADGVVGMPENQKVAAGECAIEPEEPTKDGYVFGGWYIDNECSALFEFDTRIVEDITIYAKWELNTYSIGLVQYNVTNHSIEAYINGAEGLNVNYYILDENQKEILFEKKQKLKNDNTLTRITCYLNEFELPEYFVIKITMTDDKNKEMCEYICLDYTKRYVDFFAKTIYDFDETKVINLDGQIDNNFLVANSSACVIKTDAITEVKYDETTDTYEIFGTINEIDFSDVESKVILLWNNEIICFDFDDAVISENRIVIENFNSEDCTDYFDFIKIDTTKNAAESGTQTYSLKSRAGKNSSKVEYDESGEVEFIDITLEKYITIWEPKKPIEKRSGSKEFASFFYSQKRSDSTETANRDLGSVSDSSGITIAPSVKAYFKVFWDVNWGENKFTIELGIKANGKITIELTYKEDHSLTDDSTLGEFSKGKCEIPLFQDLRISTGIPGVYWFLGFDIPIEWSIEGRLAFSVDFSIEACLKFVDGTMQNPTHPEPKLTPNIEATVTGDLFAGIRATVGAYFGTEGKHIFEVSASLTAGGNVNATMGLKTSLPPAESIHNCALCLEATLKPKIILTVQCEINAAKQIKLPLTEIEIDISKIKGEFYISLINAESSVHKGQVKFGFGKCPNVKYRHNIKAYDYYGNEYPFSLTGHMMCSDGSVKPITDTLNAEEGYYYLYNGNYRVTSTIDGKNYTRTFDVSDSTNSINILEYTVTGNIRRAETGGGERDATVTVYLRDGTKIGTYKTGTDKSNLVTGRLDTTKTKFNLPVGYSKIYAKVEHPICLPYYTAFSVPNDTGILDLGTIDLQDRTLDRSSISGIIVDTHDKALSDVSVELYNSNGELIYNTVADENGVYNFAVDLSDGQYSLNFVKNGYAYNKVLPKIVVSGAPQTSYSVVVLEESGVVEDGYIVTGIIHDTNDKPISGVRVEISNAVGEIIAPVYTDINGKFILYQSSMYSYTLRFIKDGYQASTITQPAYTTDIGIQTLASCYTVKGVVVNEKDVGLENAVVQVLNADGTLNTWEFSAFDGSFVFELVDTGIYSLSITMDNYEDTSYEFSVNERVTDLGLIPMKAATASFFVTHTANNVTTDILATSPVKMYNGIATQTWTINSSLDWTVTKSGGWFTIDRTGGAAGETVTMTVNITNSTDSQNNGTITFRTAGAEYKVTLVQKASHLKGWIVAGFERPISGAVVTASDGTTSYTCTTGANGVFDISVPNAYYSISVTAAGYENKIYDREIQINGEDVDVGEILLTRSVIASLTGTIKDGDEDSVTYGQVLEGVSLEVYDSTGKKVGDTVRSDENGIVTLDIPGADTYKFVFSLIGYETLTVDTVIINENTPSLGTYVMMRAEFHTSVSGITTPGTKLELLDENGNVIAETVADENGHYDFGDIPGWDGTIFRIRVKGTTVTVDTVGGATGVVVDTTVTIFTVSVPEIVGIDNEVGAISEWEIESSHEWSVTATGDTSWYTLSAESGNAGTFEFAVTATGATDSYRESTLTFALNNRTFDVKIYQNFAQTVSGRVVEQTEDLGEVGIENAVVVVSKADDSSLYLQTTTDANGQYTLVFEDAGEYVITAQKVGYTVTTRRLSVSSETTGIEKMTMEQTTSPYHFNGHTYLMMTPQDFYVSWDEAEAICRALGGHLVSITSEGENSFVTALTEKASSSNNGYCWIGAYKNNGDWSWSDGETFGGYTNWTNEPESTSMYGVLYYEKNDSQSGGWLNTQDDQEHSYKIICEWDDELDFLEGVCLNDLKWQFALDGTDKLTVSGEGILENDYYTAPWRNLERNISVVELTSGITEIGECGLLDAYYATEVILPDTLEKIDSYSHCNSGYRKKYTVSDDNTTYASVDGVLFSKNMTTLIEYPEGNERKEYSVPDGVTVIEKLNGDALRVINIPASVNSWNTNYVRMRSLEEINVDVDNTAFMSVEGVLFNRSGTSLLMYPAARFAEGNTYRIPDGVTTIGSYAFYQFDITDYEDVDWNNGILSIIFPESVATIGASNCFIEDFYCYRHMNLYFEGDAPLVDSSYRYSWYDKKVLERTTIYYTAGKNGWTSPTLALSYKSGSITRLLDMRIPTVLQDAYATVSGQVVDESGTPLKNVEIQGKYDDKLTGIAYTDDNGEYFFQFESATTCDLRYYLDGYETVFVDQVDITDGEYTLDIVTMTPGIAILGSGTIQGATRKEENWTLQGSELIITCGDDNSTGMYYLSEDEVEKCSFWSPNDIWRIKKINIGEGITTLRLGYISYDLSVKELYIGADVSKIEFWSNSIVFDYMHDYYMHDSIDIAIDPMNTDFVITDGALYTSDYKTLLLAPKRNRSVTDYSIRDGVEIIGKYAFNFSEYKTINIPSTVSTFEHGSFFSCGLTSIRIPSSVISIDGNVFGSSFDLHTITVDAANPEYMAVDNILYNKAQTKLITVPLSLTGSLFIPDGVTSIESGAMDGTRLDRIIIPASVTSIRSDAIRPYYSNSDCKIYFLGDVPETMSNSIYLESPLYYLEGTSGWSTPTTVIGGKTYTTEPFTMDELN